MCPMVMSTKGAKEERGSHWCCSWGFLFHSLDPQMMWGRSGSHHGPFAALKILLGPFQTGGGKHKCSTNVVRPNKNTSLLQSWQEHIVRGRTIVIHDNPLKQSQVCCAFCCDRAEQYIMARSWNERCNIPVWEVRILFSFTWRSVLPVWDVSVTRLLVVTHSVWNTIPSTNAGVHSQTQSARLLTANCSSHQFDRQSAVQILQESNLSRGSNKAKDICKDSLCCFVKHTMHLSFGLFISCVLF